MQEGNLQAFEAIFRQYYDELFFYTLRIVAQREVAEELVQDLFIHLWQKRRELVITTAPKAYLFTAMRHRSFNYLKSRMAKAGADLPLEQATEPISYPEVPLEASQLAELIELGVQSLPEKCRLIFHLSREMGLSYDEIAKELDVSRETVKSQIKIALQKLRIFLGKHWEMLVFFIGFHRF